MTDTESHDPQKRLAFIPGDWADVVFVVTSNRGVRVLVWLIAPIARFALWFRRAGRRVFSASIKPPNVR